MCVYSTIWLPCMCCVHYESHKYGNREPNFICIFSVRKWGDVESLGTADPNVPIVRSSVDRCTCSICGIVGRERPKCSQRSTHRCYFVQNKSSTDYHGTELGSPLYNSASESSSILELKFHTTAFLFLTTKFYLSYIKVKQNAPIVSFAVFPLPTVIISYLFRSFLGHQLRENRWQEMYKTFLCTVVTKCCFCM